MRWAGTSVRSTQWLSLDGYAEDRNGTLDFFPSTEENRFSDRDQLAFLGRVDTTLLGRRTYELFVDFWPTATTDREIVADRLNAIPKVVCSNTQSEAPWDPWQPARVARGGAIDEVRRLKAQEGKDIVLWGSLSLARQLMAADLIDDYHLQLCPTFLGGGRRLFPDLPDELGLRRVSTRTYDTGVTVLHYERRRGGQPPRRTPDTLSAVRRACVPSRWRRSSRRRAAAG